MRLILIHIILGRRNEIRLPDDKKLCRSLVERTPGMLFKLLMMNDLKEFGAVRQFCASDQQQGRGQRVKIVYHEVQHDPFRFFPIYLPAE
jgi:hypothetical protein